MAVRSADQISIVDLTDAYSVILTNDSYTFPGTINAAKAGSCTTQIIAMRGSEQIPATVDLAAVTKPTGITVTKDQNATSPTLTITASTSFTTAGVVKIPVVVDGEITITKDFSVAIAFTGATGGQGPQGETGKGISSVGITYQGSTSNTTPPTGTWAATPPSVAANSYLWTRIIFTYTDSTTSDPMYSVAKQGGPGTNGTSAVWYTGNKITGTSTTATAFPNSGISAAKVGDMYLNTDTYNTYRCTTAGAASAAKWVYVANIRGGQGIQGEAAISIAITSSNGTIFKNTAIETVLTAHVYQGGAEVTGTALTALGTIKWYKDGGSTAVATGQTLTISSGDVTGKASYIAQLEG